MPKTNTSGLSVTLSTGELPKGRDLCRAYVVVIEGETSSIVDLAPNAPLVIGREPECGVPLSSSDVSRRHAELCRTTQGATLADLGSRHGTLVNDESVASDSFRALRSGDRISIGSAQLVFHCDAAPMLAQQVLGETALRSRIREEVQRAVFYQRELSVLCFYSPHRTLDQEALIPLLEQGLSIIDVWGVDSSGELVVVMPDTDRTRAARTTAQLQAELQRIEPAIRCGVACCPEDGCDADTIRSVARRNATRGRQGVSDTAPNVVAIGERSVIVSDPTMESVYNLIRRVAKSSLPVLINGETGVGKEIAANAIHAWSSRKDAPFIALNCAALPAELAESALFGHERGAFTGAVSQTLGVFESANSGTVFLDELGELPLTIQAKLLRVLDNQRVTRLGDVKERSIDVRLIAATNRDLKEEIRAGRFREDLFFRLSTARVVLPPLRDRPRDLTALASQLLTEACKGGQRSKLELSPGAKMALHSHRWPGNIRELKNAMRFVAATAEAEVAVVEAWHLPEDIGSSNSLKDQNYSESPRHDDAAAPQQRRGFRPVSEELRELEEQRMREALEACNFVQIDAARLISMPMRTFATKVKRYKLLQPRTR